MTSQTQSPDLNAIKQRQQNIWAPGDYTQIGARILIVSELLCEAVDLFGKSFVSLHLARHAVVKRSRSPEHFVAFYRSHYGSTIKAFEALDPQGQECLARDLKDLVCRFNCSDDDTLVWPHEYLEVVAVKR